MARARRWGPSPSPGTPRPGSSSACRSALAGWGRLALQALASLAHQVLLDEQETIRPGPADHRQQVVHGGDLLQLLLDEPVEEAHPDVVLVRLGDLDQIVDLARHLLLPGQGLRDRLLGGAEFTLGG